MPVSNFERMKIMSDINSLGHANSEERYQQELTRLQLHRNMLDLGSSDMTLTNKEFEMAVEFVVIFEALQEGIGWWGRTKRRLELVREFS